MNGSNGIMGRGWTWRKAETHDDMIVSLSGWEEITCEAQLGTLFGKIYPRWYDWKRQREKRVQVHIHDGLDWIGLDFRHDKLSARYGSRTWVPGPWPWSDPTIELWPVHAIMRNLCLAAIATEQKRRERDKEMVNDDDGWQGSCSKSCIPMVKKWERRYTLLMDRGRIPHSSPPTK